MGTRLAFPELCSLAFLTWKDLLLSCPERSAPTPASHQFKDVVEPLGRVPDAAARLESAHTSKDEVATHELRQALHIFGRDAGCLSRAFYPTPKTITVAPAASAARN
jgi:hypothetical protein